MTGKKAMILGGASPNTPAELDPKQSGQGSLNGPRGDNLVDLLHEADGLFEGQHGPDLGGLLAF
jgi:hypothetical protein